MNKNIQLQDFSAFFEPKTVAVVGASARNPHALPNTFIRRIRDFGFAGEIYPINPTASEVEGYKCYPSLAETPQPVDYAYIGVSSGQIPAMLEAAKGRTKFAHVVSSGFGEVDEGKALQAQLVAAARAGGMRLVGPNCMGL